MAILDSIIYSLVIILAWHSYQYIYPSLIVLFAIAGNVLAREAFPNLMIVSMIS